MTLISPGVSVTIVNESYYIPAAAPTVPLIFLATRADKKQADGITAATAVAEHSIVRTITSLNQSISSYGVPNFLIDNTGAPMHGDCRNEYGVMALNQALTMLNVVYVVRANVDLADAPYTVLSASTPIFVGTGNGTISAPTVNATTGVAELWTIVAKSTAPILTLGAISNPGSLYIDGTYTAVPLTGGTGSGATATITVLGGAVTASILTAPGIGYTVGDVLSVSNTNLGNTGSGFTQPVATINTLFSVSGFLSGAQSDASMGVLYNNGIVSFTIANGSTPFTAGDAWTFNVVSTIMTNPLGANDAAKRVTITDALIAEINSNMDVRSDIYEYNLILCPGYFETTAGLLNLNDAINDEAFVISDCPFDKSPEDTATWSLTVARQTNNNVAYYYPNALASNLDGKSVFCAASGVALKTIAYSDSVSEVWMPPAGFRRGIVTGVTDVGYVTGQLGTATTFVSTPLNQGQRDVLYQYPANVNPIGFFPGQGLAVFGQKTSVGNLASALDRINVDRLMLKIKRDIRKASMSYLFELNDRITRDSIKLMIDNYLNDILLRRGLYDYVVVCDTTNNTPTRIDRNELWVDIAVQPEKSIEFIYIPINVVSTGASTA
jgi:hypothetical protein